MSDRSDGTAGDGAPSRASPAHADSTASKYNQRNPAVKRILREMREMAEDASPAYHAEAVEEDIFEWHFAILGAEDSEFEGGIYHGRVLLPPEYPFKPPSFVLLTPSGRFETNTKICLSITQHHPEHWQPSWSVRTALTAVRAFMPSPAEGAVGSLDYSKEERRKLAERSRRAAPEFGASPERREVARRAHAAALRKWADSRRGETVNADEVNEPGKDENDETTREKSPETRARDESSHGELENGERSTRSAPLSSPLSSVGGAPAETDSDRRISARLGTLLNPKENPENPVSGLEKTPNAIAFSNVPASRDESCVAEAEADGRPYTRAVTKNAGAADARDRSQTAGFGNQTTFPATPSRSEDRDPRKTETETETTPRSSTRLLDTPSARLPPVPAEADSTRSSGRRESDAASGPSSAAPLPPFGGGAPRRRRREPDSPEVARLKQKLDVTAAFLLFAIAAILARRFLAHVASSRDEF